jgi:hypothetical protein
MQTEHNTADNIKDARHRREIKRSLQRLIVALKPLKSTATGWAVFASPERAMVVEPCRPLTVALYRCDRRFILTPLEEQTSACDLFGLVLVSGSNSTFWKLEVSPALLIQNKSAVVKRTMINQRESFVRNRHSRGGFSQNRFQRLRGHEVKNYVENVYHDATRLLPDVPTLFFGSHDKLSQAVSSAPEHASIVTGDPKNNKACEVALDAFLRQFYKLREEAYLAPFFKAIDTADSRVVIGAECHQAASQGLLQTSFTNQSVFGFSPVGQRFLSEFQEAGLLFPGCHADILET